MLFTPVIYLEKARRLAVSFADMHIEFRKRLAEHASQYRNNHVFSAEMVGVNEVYPLFSCEKEMIVFDISKTHVTATPIPIALVNVVVMARDEHIPSIKQKIGFSVVIPFLKIANLFFIVFFLP